MASTLGLLLVRHVFRLVEPGPTQTKDVEIGHSAPPLLCTVRFACPATPRLTPKPCHPWLGSCLGSDGPPSSVTPATVLHGIESSWDVDGPTLISLASTAAWSTWTEILRPKL